MATMVLHWFATAQDIKVISYTGDSRFANIYRHVYMYMAQQKFNTFSTSYCTTRKGLSKYYSRRYLNYSFLG